jgi:hypothetical protein
MKLPLFWLLLRAQVLEDGAEVWELPMSPKEIWLLPPGVTPVLLKRDIIEIDGMGSKRIRAKKNISLPRSDHQALFQPAPFPMQAGLHSSNRRRGSCARTRPTGGGGGFRERETVI